MALQLAELASEAYVFGFPLVFSLEQVERISTNGMGRLPAADVNRFSHARSLAGPDDRLPSADNDTLCSIAQVDLSAGPVLLSVPEAADRYHVLQFVDAWTNDFAYLGTRSTGGHAGEYLLVPPDWESADDNDGVTVIRFPTRVSIIVGRWAVDGAADLPAVHALQDALSLTPLAPALTRPQGVAIAALPPDRESDALVFFEKLRLWSHVFPPAERDRAALDSYSDLGLVGPDPLTERPAGFVSALEEGYAAGKEALTAALRSGRQVPQVNGWSESLHQFDYNLDFFELGTIDAPEWKAEDPRTRYAQRAAAALGDLWGSHGYEASSWTIVTDAAGETLTGEHVYTLRLDPTPPVGAFWSLSMYDAPDSSLVDNPLARYSVGSRTRGIVYDDDGGLTITMSTTKPSDPEVAANWLPSPEGPFRPILRMYLPGRQVLDGRYVLPAIERVD